MTTNIRADASGTYGALQVNGSDVLRFGSDTSGNLAGFRNVIINGNFAVNQRAYVSGAAVGAALYGHDRWKMAASADTYTFSTTANVTTVTIPAGKVLRQVIEGLNLQSGTYTLSWQGTAQGKIGAGAYGASGITGSIIGGTNTTIEFGPGTVSRVQLELGSIATSFENRTIGTELALCQRYLPYVEVRVNSLVGTGQCISTTVGQIMVNFPVQARVPPTSVSGPGASSLYLTNAAYGAVTCISYSLSYSGLTSALIVASVASGLVAGNATLLATTGTFGFLFNGCEL